MPDSPADVPVRKNHLARDITHDFRRASSALRVGQLVKDEAFTLYDSVQALEIMDPKMDAGFLEPGETLDPEYDISRNLLPGEILWIMDQMLCYQMAWHQGYALSQNLFSSLYIDNLLSAKTEAGRLPSFVDAITGATPNELTQRVLGAFCVSIVKSTDIAIELVASQQYYEEEDFNTQTFGRDLLTEVADHDYFAMLEDAYAWVEIAVEDSRMRGALQARLLLTVRLLDTVFPVPEDFPNLSAGEDFTKDLLATTRRTHHLGKAVDDAFSSKLHRRLASTTPPRPLNVVAFDDACSIMAKIREDLVEASNLNYVDPDADMQQVEAFLWAFADREALALPRAAVQIHLFSEGRRAGAGSGDLPAPGIETMMWMELQGYLPKEHTIKHEIFRAEAPTDENFKTAAAVSFWFKKASQTFSDTLRSLCQNPCRIRRCLTNILQELRQLLNLLEDEFRADVDDAQSRYTLSTYIRVIICEVTRLVYLRASAGILALGYRQDLYQERDVTVLQYRADILSEIWVCTGRTSSSHPLRKVWGGAGAEIARGIAALYTVLGSPTQDSTTILDTAMASKAALRSLGIFDLQKDGARFLQFWDEARLSTTEAADQYWKGQLKVLCQTVIALGIHATTLKKGLERYGPEGLVGKIKVQMPETRSSQYILPKKIDIL